MANIQRALISVSDKTGLIPLAEALARANIEIISTGGTAKTLREAGLTVKDITEHTGFTRRCTAACCSFVGMPPTRRP
jgi:phosphoribosylaminoimidazolecarboxamide formyltransferase / IMP cyclohydrolase